jgi:hypothetical protein
MRVGSKDFVYEVVHDWGRLPAGWSFGSVPNGACDSQGSGEGDVVKAPVKTGEVQ